MTAGIVNIPLTYPAILFFNTKWDKIKDVIGVMESYKIPFTQTHTTNTKGETIFHIRSIEKIDSKTIKSIWRNWKTLRPKFETQWRYLFWEIDTTYEPVFEFVKSTYEQLDLPVIIHRTMNGYHFISIKPILEPIWKTTIERLRPTNKEYPPITLRIKPNKYVGEMIEYNKMFVISTSYHKDTQELAKWIKCQDIERIIRDYYVVWYKFNGQTVEEMI